MSTTTTNEETAKLIKGDAEISDADVLVVVADRDDPSDTLDAAAGCEFVDDRIREDDEITAAGSRP